MIATLIVLLASTLAAIYNYLLRKSSDSPKNVQNFVVMVLASSFLFSLVFENGFLSSWLISGLAVFSGLLVSLIFLSLPKAFSSGPSGLTIAIFQSACLLPPVLMASIFGCRCGFTYTVFHFSGAVLVLFGLLLSALKGPKQPINRKWGFYMATIFLSQALILTIYQYKALLVKPGLPEHLLIAQVAVDWYFPLMFLSALVFTLFLKSEKLSFNKKELVQGLAGGFFNAGNSLLLLLGLIVATPFEIPFLVPVNAVGTIFLCNLWSQWFFKEKIHWLGSSIALLGILLSFIEL